MDIECNCPDNEIDLVPEHNICVACGKPYRNNPLPYEYPDQNISIAEQQEKTLRKAIGDELYEWLERQVKRKKEKKHESINNKNL